MLKIDRSFVSRLCNSFRDEQVVALVVALAHGMRATTVAEGIEESQQATALEYMGCDNGQGYLFAAPFSEERALEDVRRTAHGYRYLWDGLPLERAG